MTKKVVQWISTPSKVMGQEVLVSVINDFYYIYNAFIFFIFYFIFSPPPLLALQGLFHKI